MSVTFFFRILCFLCAFAWWSASLWSMNTDDNTLQEVQIDHKNGLTLNDLKTELENSYEKKSTLSSSSKTLAKILIKYGLWFSILVPFPGAAISCPKYFNGTGVDLIADKDTNNTLNSISQNICPVALGLFAPAAMAALIPILEGSYVVLQNYYAFYKNKPKARWLTCFINHRCLENEVTEKDIAIIDWDNFPGLVKQINLKQAMILAEINPDILFNAARDFIHSDVKDHVTVLLNLLKMEPSALLHELKTLDDKFKKAPCFWQALVRIIPQQIFDHEIEDETVASVLKSALVRLILPLGFMDNPDVMFDDIREKRDSIDTILAISTNTRIDNLNI